MGLNVKLKTIKILERKTGENLCDIELGKNYLDTTLKVQSIKEKFDILSFIKMKNFCFFSKIN